MSMKKSENQIMIMVPKEEWDDHRSNIIKILEFQKKGRSPLEGYVTKKAIQDLYDFSDATWFRLKRKGIFSVRKLGGLQFVKIEDFIQAIESESI